MEDLISIITWLAPAKLNLFLHITSRRSNGYHNLQTVFQLLNYYDELQFFPRRDDKCLCKINFSLPNKKDIPSEINSTNNLIIHAARLLQKITGKRFGVTIHLLKRIPIGAGLGGGSSNAATTLMALNRLWQLNLSCSELAKIGLQLGADIPVFIGRKTAWAEGIGEMLKPITLKQTWFAVIVPAVSVSTQIIFSDPELTRDTPPITIHCFSSGATKNDCEAVVRKRYPAINLAINWLSQFGQAYLTGTGSCVFTKLKTKKQAEMLVKQVPPTLSGFVAKGVNQSLLLK